MKRGFLAVIILLLAGAAVFAQQSGGANRPSSADTKQTATQYLNEAKSNSSHFTEEQANLNTRNASNKDAYTFNRLKSEIDRLEKMIDKEEANVGATLDRGTKVSSESLDRIQRMHDQYKAKIAELEAFISS